MGDKLQRFTTRTAIIFGVAAMVCLLSGCDDSANAGSGENAAGEIQVKRFPAIRSTLAVPTETPSNPTFVAGVTLNAPTLTPLPTATTTPESNGLAARVNDTRITTEQFEAELKRYVAGQPNAPAYDSDAGQELAEQLKDTVLDGMIEQILIDQEATQNKITINDAQIDAELKVIKEKAGGDTQYQAWLMANQQSEQDARHQIHDELITNALAQKVLAALPKTAEYIHAAHIVVATQTEAEGLLAELQNGAQFDALARAKSIDDSTRADGGDLDWFTRGTGTVLWTEVEDAAFALQPGETSAIVKSPIGYHIIRVLERKTRDLTDSDKTYLQREALRNWINQLKASAVIKKYV